MNNDERFKIFIKILVLLIVIVTIISRKGKLNDEIIKTKRKGLHEDPDSPLFDWHNDEILYRHKPLIPWEDVFYSKIVDTKNSQDSFLQNIGDRYGIVRENIIVILYRSSEESWRDLAGREGYLLIDRIEKKQIDFILTIMS